MQPLAPSKSLFPSIFAFLLFLSPKTISLAVAHDWSEVQCTVARLSLFRANFKQRWWKAKLENSFKRRSKNLSQHSFEAKWKLLRNFLTENWNFKIWKNNFLIYNSWIRTLKNTIVIFYNPKLYINKCVSKVTMSRMFSPSTRPH